MINSLELLEKIPDGAWSFIEGHEGRYYVSTDGNVFSACRRGKLLKPNCHTNGYLTVVLIKRDGTRCEWLIHRLVAQAFLPNPQGLPQVNHKNRIKSDNRLANLEWCTGSENILHSYKDGCHKGTHGITNGQAKLTDAAVLSIQAALASGVQGVQLANQYGVSKSLISLIKHGRAWAHLNA